MKKLLIANWKQNKNLAEIKSWMEVFSQIYEARDDLEIVICPPFLYLEAVFDSIKTHKLKGVSVGAQDVSETLKGSHTGEVSATQVKDFCKYSIVGHSERDEPWNIVNTKVQECLENQIIPILCLKNESAFDSSFDDRILLTWEDPNNISKNGSFSVLSSDETLKEVLKIREKIGSDRGLIYGGSVNPENIEALEGLQNFIGYLVGQASLDPNSFVSLARKIRR